ncbi:uncharacterized protein LOC132552002 [Ylistrum balloti]|uniref:uncharacterized protein LOC132552002 n=1 Tax=Ylistrum balloti TaxID=509963 RepID=UPI0029058EA8|nr:uncharacterized protein LOC132552002 [Ylistrum balloti]
MADMEVLVAVILLTASSAIHGQLMVPQDVAIVEQHDTLMGLTQFGVKNSDASNGLSLPKEILRESLAQTQNENQKNKALKSKFPVAPTSDLLGVTDVQKPKKVSKQEKPPDPSKKDKYAPLPSGVDFLSTSISSQEMVERLTSAKKEKSRVSPGRTRDWKNLVKSDPRQVGDRIDMVIEKRMNGNSLSPGAVISSPNGNKLLKSAPMKKADIYMNEPDLPWVHAAVELTPKHTWTESTIIRSSIGPMKMAEISTNAVQVTKKKKKISDLNGTLKTTAATLLDVSSTPSTTHTVSLNTEPHDTLSFHLQTTDKKVQNPATPSTVGGWTAWVDPLKSDVSPAWFKGQETNVNVPTDRNIAESTSNSLDITTKTPPTKQSKPTSDPFINDEPMELPTDNDLQKPHSKGFFASWNPWKLKSEPTSNSVREFTESSKTGKEKNATVPSTSLPTILKNTEHSHQGISADEGQQPVNVEFVNETVNTAESKQTTNFEVSTDQDNSPGKQIISPEISTEANNTAPAEKAVSTNIEKQTVDNDFVEETVNLENEIQAANTISVTSTSSPNVSESSGLLNNTSSVQSETKKSIPQSLLGILKLNEQNNDLSTNDTYETAIPEPIDQTVEVESPPKSNFDPLLLPPTLASSDGNGFQHEEINQSPPFGGLPEASFTDLKKPSFDDARKQDFGRPGLSPSNSKRRFFVSPSPHDLIPPQEHLHEGILHPIEPDIPQHLLDKTEHSTDVKSNSDLEAKDVLSQKREQNDMTNSITGHGSKVFKHTSIHAPSTSTFVNTMHRSPKMKSRVNANSILGSRSEITSSTPADLIGSEQLSTSSDPNLERKALLHQIREALISLNGGTTVMKPLNDIDPLSHEPGLTHALIGSINDFSSADPDRISPSHVKNVLATAKGGSGIKDNNGNVHKHGTKQHTFEETLHKHLFHDPNNLHMEHSSNHITLDEKAIRRKLLSPDINSHSHFGHAGPHEHHEHTPHNFAIGSHMGLDSSLSGADLDLSQDLTRNPMLNVPIATRNLENHIEESNRESAKLRFFKTPKTSKNVNILTRFSDPTTGEKRKEHSNIRVPLIEKHKETENGTLVNTNSIFFDPETHKPVNPFHNVSSDVLRNAHSAWEHAVANVKTHIDPIPEIAAVVGDKKNAVRVGSVSSVRVGEIPPPPSQQPSDPNAAFHFLDPITNAVVPIAAVPEMSPKDHAHPPNPHMPLLPNIAQMFDGSVTSGEKPPLPFINPMSAPGDINSEDGFFVGPVLFGPVENPPPNGEIEISGPVLAMGLSPDDESKHGNHKPPKFDVNEILDGIFKDDNHKLSTKAKPLTQSINSPNHTAPKPNRSILSKTKIVKPVAAGQININPFQQVARVAKRKNSIPSARFPTESGFRKSISNQQGFHAPGDQSSMIQPRKDISKSLWNALAKILKANKRKELLSKQNAHTRFQKSFPPVIKKEKMLQRPAQIQSNKPSKIDMQKIINILKARQKLFGLKKKSTAPKIRKQKKTRTTITKSPLGGRSQISERSEIGSVKLRKHGSTIPQRHSSSVSTNKERPAQFRNNKYQLLLQLLKAKQLKHNRMGSNIANVPTNLRSSQINSVARPAQRAIGHSPVNVGIHNFIPKLQSTHRSSAVRPIPISTMHQWPFSAPITNRHPSMNTQHFLPRYRVWPQKQIRE